MLIIVSGLPGTGKTTFAKALAEKLGARHINSDVIRDELGKRGQYNPETKALIYEQMRERTDAYLQAGADVIVDATFYTDSYREPYLQLAKAHGQPLKWIELEADENTIRERVGRRRAYSEADFAVYQKIKKAYEPLLVDHLVLVSDQMPMHDMLEKASNYLKPG